MAYEWSEFMRGISPAPAHEERMRAAVRAGALAIENIADTELPLFGGGTMVSGPRNESAKALAAVVDRELAEIRSPTKMHLRTTAIRAAMYIRLNGWDAFAGLLTDQHAARTARAREEEEAVAGTRPS